VPEVCVMNIKKKKNRYSFHQKAVNRVEEDCPERCPCYYNNNNNNNNRNNIVNNSSRISG